MTPARHRLIVHTNFTDTRQEVHELRLDDLDTPRNLDILRAVFFAPHRLKPGATSEAITTEVARKVGERAVFFSTRLSRGEVIELPVATAFTQS